ncbi:MAG: hypothetical protein KDA41_10575 [Planctomycetales bacterium]|nr:hypothetical protein [Planctomycetales bacterium]
MLLNLDLLKLRPANVSAQQSDSTSDDWRRRREHRLSISPPNAMQRRRIAWFGKD